MTVVNGKVNASITGLVRAIADHIFFDNSTTPKTLVNMPYEAAITNGSFSITVPQSQNLSGSGVTTEGITYSFQLFNTISTIVFTLLDGTVYTGPNHQWTTGTGADSLWYTGSTHDTSSRRLDRTATSQNVQIGETIHAIVPDSATPVDFANLVAINARQPYLDITIFRILELLTTVQTYKDRISTKFALRGAYNASTYYVLYDIASYNGNSYAWKNASSLNSQTPPVSGDDANWTLIAAKGAAGGTGAQIIGWNPAAPAWATNDAAARQDVKDAIASVSSVDLSQYLKIVDGAPRANPTFTGNVKRGSLTFPVADTDKPTEIITAKYVDDAIAASSQVGRLPKPIIWARRTNNQQIVAAGNTQGTISVAWDSVLLGTSYMSGGVFTVPATGNYLILVCLWIRMRASNAYEPTKMTYRAFLNSQSAGELESFYRGDLRSTYSIALDQQHQGMLFENGLTANDQITVRTTVTYTNGATAYNPDGDTPTAIMGSVAQNFMYVWRVSD